METLEKGFGKKDFGKLVKKKVMDKTGQMRTVWVSAGEKVKTAVKKKVHDVQEKQAKDYDTSKAGSLMKRKAKAIVKSIKNEVKEWKEAGSGLKKFFTGEKPTKHEIQAIKAIAIHTAIVTGIAVVGSASITAFATNLGLGYLEHTGILRIGHALLFAKADFEAGKISESDYDKHLERFVKEMGEYMEQQNKKDGNGTN